jgi:hypothetical protein
MAVGWSVVLTVCLALPVAVSPGNAQAPTPGDTLRGSAPPDGRASVSAGDSSRVLVLEHQFTGEVPDSVVVELARHVFYVVEVSRASGTPVAKPLRKHQFPAIVASTGQALGGGERFEMHTGWSGPHAMSLPELAPGSTAVVKLYRDEAATRRAADSHDRDLAMGFLLAAGRHSGYRLDPTGGEPPAGGGDVEGCVLAESGSRFGACIGSAVQSFPDADFAVTWFFVEPRFRLLSGTALGTSRTDLGISIRIAQGVETGRRHLSPSQLAFGVHIVQHLATQGFRRGWSVYAAYHRGWLGNVPETEFRSTNRFMTGLAWVP